MKAVHVALLIVQDRGTAEVLVQEAFLRANRKIGQFDTRRRFGPWFLQSVIHAAIKAAASQNRAAPLEETQDGGRLAAWLIDPSLGPQEIVEKAEAHEAIWQARQRLSPNQRAAVVMHYFLDQSDSEMIRELNRPRSTIKWWLQSARMRLRQLLHPLKDGEMENQEAEHE